MRNLIGIQSTRRSILLAAPALIFGASQASAKSLRVELKLMKEEFLEQGTTKFNFRRVREERKIDMGACITTNDTFFYYDAGLRAIQENFSLAVPEWALNWDMDFDPTSIEEKLPPIEVGHYKRNKYALKRFFELVDQLKLKTRAHALYYHHAFPKYVLKLIENEASDKRLEATIIKLIEHRVDSYKGRINYWVINEIFVRDGSLKRDRLIQRLGLDIVVKICKAAQAVNPKISFELCDQNIASEPGDRALTSCLRLVDKLRKNSVNISDIGVQAHFDLDRMPDLRLAPYEAMMREGIRFGVTELDVNDRPFRGAYEEREFQIAVKYYTYLRAVTKMKNLTVVTSWALSDRTNWINRGVIDGGSFDGNSSIGWFDRTANPKFLYYVTARALLS